jgi:hypothetical protein
VGGAGGGIAIPGGLTEDVTASNWHITGLVNNYNGFAVGMVCLVDASAFTGIEFTIKGNAGTPNRLTMQVATSSDEAGTFDPTAPASLGMCTGVCTAPSTTINVTATETLIQLPWSAFTGGRPIASVNPAQLVRLLWGFAWSGTATPYPVDVTLDNLHFMTAPADGGTD